LKLVVWGITVASVTPMALLAESPPVISDLWLGVQLPPWMTSLKWSRDRVEQLMQELTSQKIPVTVRRGTKPQASDQINFSAWRWEPSTEKRSPYWDPGSDTWVEVNPPKLELKFDTKVDGTIVKEVIKTPMEWGLNPAIKVRAHNWLTKTGFSTETAPEHVLVTELKWHRLSLQHYPGEVVDASR